jgi:hypothetical protein
MFVAPIQLPFQHPEVPLKESSLQQLSPKEKLAKLSELQSQRYTASNFTLSPTANAIPPTNSPVTTTQFAAMVPSAKMGDLDSTISDLLSAELKGASKQPSVESAAALASALAPHTIALGPVSTSAKGPALTPW